MSRTHRRHIRLSELFICGLRVGFGGPCLRVQNVGEALTDLTSDVLEISSNWGVPLFGGLDGVNEHK